MHKDEETEEIPVREEPKEPACEKEVTDEILYRRVLKPTGVPQPGDILRFM